MRKAHLMGLVIINRPDFSPFGLAFRVFIHRLRVGFYVVFFF